MNVTDYADGSYKIGEDYYSAEANYYCKQEDVECAVRRIVEDKDLNVEQSVSDTVSFGFGSVSINGQTIEDTAAIQAALLALLALQGFFYFYLS